MNGSLCHDGFGGAHPGQDCRLSEDDGFGGSGKESHEVFSLVRAEEIE